MTDKKAIKQEADLLSIVNASGFSFQLAIEQLIRGHIGKIPWRATREHHWLDPDSGAEGFSDIVVDSPLIMLVLECKRTTGGEWVFLVPDHEERQTQRFRGRWVERYQDVTPVHSWDDYPISPLSVESSFCIVRGHGEGQVPFLERISSELLSATNGIANQWTQSVKGLGTTDVHIFIPMIVTNAKLYLCRFDASKTPIGIGQIARDGAKFELASVVRFRKSFGRGVNTRVNEISDLNSINERSVLVVNSSELGRVLTEFNLIRPFGGYLWEQRSIQRVTVG